MFVDLGIGCLMLLRVILLASRQVKIQMISCQNIHLVIVFPLEHMVNLIIQFEIFHKYDLSVSNNLFRQYTDKKHEKFFILKII